MHARESLPYWEQTIKSNSGEGSEGDQKRQRATFRCPREDLSGLEQNIYGNRDSQGHSDEVLDGNRVRVIGNWRKGHPCYKLVKDAAELCSCPSILWKTEL